MNGEHELLREALSYLSGAGRRPSPERLLADLRQRFRSAGTGRMADLVYEMVKASLQQLPDFASRIVLEIEPRQAEVISGEMGTLRACLDGLRAAPDLSSVQRVSSSAGRALEDAEICLAVLERLEGATGRQRLALGLQRAYLGQHAAAEGLLRPLLDDPLQPEPIRFFARLNLGFSLVRQRRDAEVLVLAEEAHAMRPDHAVPLANLATAAARTHDRARFLGAIEAMRALFARTGDPYVARWMEAWLDEHGREAGLPAAELEGLRALPARC